MEPHVSATMWEEFRRELRSRVSTQAWHTWIEPLSLSLRERDVYLEAPSDFHVRWVSDRYLPIIQEVAVKLLDPETDVVLTAASVEPADQPAGSGESATQPAKPLGSFVPGGSPPTSPTADARLIPKYTFDNFVVGQSNRFAHAAAMAVAEQPGSHYNPLYIYGGAGLGKTHLLHAVGHHCRELVATTVVRYVSSEQFFNEFINGIRTKRMDAFKARYRTIDVLLLDDVQFFEGKEQILEEFFHTFNSLYEAGRQLVISSDRQPKHLSTLEVRLRSRFEWGLLTDIQPPDVETRLAILRKNAEYAPTPVPTEVLEFIATHVLDNIRELEGALTRVTAYAALTGDPITLAVAHKVLQDVLPSAETRPLTAADIITATASLYGLTPEAILDTSRKQPIARARQVAMYLSREHTDMSLPSIGRTFNRDHSTVIHAIEKVKTLMQTDQELFNQVTNLSHALRRT